MAVERQSETQEAEVPFGPHTLNLQNATLQHADGTLADITAMEFQLLRAFYKNQGVVLSRDKLAEIAHDRSWDPFDRSIDIRVSRLRRKIEANPSKPELIQTVRGIGYIYN